VEHQQRVSIEVFDVLHPSRVEVSGALDPGDASFSLGPDIPELERSPAVQKRLELLGGDLPNASRGVGHVGDVGILQLEGPGVRSRRSRRLQLGEQPRDVAGQGIDTQVGQAPHDDLPHACGGAAGVITIDGAERVAAPWWTASMLLPSGSKTKAA